MIASMTGYGAGTRSSSNYQVTVELKSLNSKYLEIAMKLPRVYLKHENTIRNMISEKLVRGKVVFLLNVEVLNAEKQTLNIDRDRVKRFKEELGQLADYVGVDQKIDLGLLLSLPEVLPTELEQEDEEEWKLIKLALTDAIEKIMESRIDEGKALDRDLSERVSAIGENLEKIKELAPVRIENMRNRLDSALEDLKRKTEIDQNRFEQELIFYIEKFDINEEIVRLAQHITYFEELRQTNTSNGKKLQFLSQEMGREINTIGSKANDASIQRVVVKMKDELDKIKEQVLNIL
ncbi:YicC/YloC family endoribonuclease [Pontibacter sp. G13]|uniref:YicC/YloC family endoribonuclease n=1 Tax=Pontibacter sp. G13 TaxID=3074898 RepID=UPI00288B855F|nr:YicC/YloC family endoribonuclease [Pontibacter sp. G13]WNJ15925.1 YicC/YloC family endoribonuclease [Pontibacter sp. G13]